MKNLKNRFSERTANNLNSRRNLKSKIRRRKSCSNQNSHSLIYLTCCLMSLTRQRGNFSMLPRFLKSGTITSSVSWQKCSAKHAFHHQTFPKTFQRTFPKLFKNLPRAFGQMSPRVSSFRSLSFASFGERSASSRVKGALEKKCPLLPSGSICAKKFHLLPFHKIHGLVLEDTGPVSDNLQR